jgi:hypothetical protein
VVEGDLLAARLGGGSEPCLISTGQATSHTSSHFLADFWILDFVTLCRAERLQKSSDRRHGIPYIFFYLSVIRTGMLYPTFYRESGKIAE